MSAVRPLEESVAIARDSYLRAAEQHRRMAAQYLPITREGQAHLRLAAQFNLKAEMVCDVLARPRRKRGTQLA